VLLNHRPDAQRNIELAKQVTTESDHRESVAPAHRPCHNPGMGPFRTPQIVLFTRDMERARTFYGALGFDETFRTPMTGSPIHVDLVLDGYRLGLATASSAREDHGLDPAGDSQRATVVLWSDDAPAGYARLVELGATPIKPPAPWLDRLLVAWAEDPDGHLVQVVQATG
jgi:catechol 2,3-dioxygenase-like lactoylglutathione lyase family enzyme